MIASLQLDMFDESVECEDNSVGKLTTFLRWLSQLDQKDISDISIII